MECPEAMEHGRNFRLLAEDELSQLLDFLAGYLPESLKFHQTLLTYTRDRVWDFHFYVANDWPEDAICLHFPGMTLAPHGLLYESVGVFCPNDRLELLNLLREEDILIDWSKPLYINFVHRDISEVLARLYEGTGTIDRVVGDVFACVMPENADNVDEPDEEANPDVQVLPLKAEHAEGIHELYPANDMECHEVFLRLIRSLPAAGVFAKGRLAAWMVQSYYGAMFSMQTKPEYRRKGYGTKLARYLTKRVAERGYRPFVVIRPENVASQSLYKKLGFRKLYQTVRMTFMPFTWQEMGSETSHILRDNMKNFFRQLTIEHGVVDAFRNEKSVDEEIVVSDAVEDSAKDIEDGVVVVEAPGEKTEECEDPPEEDAAVKEFQDRIEVTDLPVEENAKEAADNGEQEANAEETLGDAEGTSHDDGSNQDDGGTGAGNSE